MKIHAALKQQDAILCFCVSLGSAEAVVRRGEKIKHLLTDYFLSNISVKNYQNRFMYVKVIARQSTTIFETECT